MCGIAGIVRLDGGEVEKWRLEAMNKAMAHRGPDGEGFYNRGGIGLAHRRLAIIDLATGQQPMFNEDGAISIVFNGEIYNFLDLKSELQSLGHIFRTQSDTEVLLHAYEEWGDRMLSRLNGMFAFAIYDSRQSKLFLARDRLGVKPLYYYVGKDAFVFASEMGGMMASGLIPHEVDRSALDLYLHYQYVPAPYSIYRNVKKLCPAEYLELDIPTAEVKITTYWAIDATKPPVRSKKMEEWIEELDVLLNDAVRIRLVSDVPFGAFLSGGTDSGLTVAMMANKLNQPVKTFSVGLTDGGEDELPYARTVAEKYNTDHEEFRVSAQGLMLIPKLCGHFGEPFADSSAVPTYYISQIARSQVKMVLTGDGGDEMFAGYRTYSYLVNPPQTLQLPFFPHLSPRLQLLIYQALQRIPYAIEAVKKGIALTARIRPTRKETRPWYEVFDSMMSHFSLNERAALLDGNSHLSDVDYYASRFPYPAADSPVAAAQYVDFKSYLTGDILVKVDRMSMANSLETRSALLDYRIAELAFSMPTSVKLPEPLLDGSRNKFVLKELASHYLGREYAYRPKEGFGIPIDQWLREDKEGYLHDTLLNNSSPIYDHLDRALVRNIVKAHLDKRMAWGHKVWNLLMLDGWLRYVHNVNTVSSLKNG